MKPCSVCSEIKPLATRSSKCKECHNAYTREHYKNNKQYYKDKAKKNSEPTKKAQHAWLIGYKSEHPCVDCGNPDVEVLQFDHRDRELKEANVGTLIGGSFEKLKAEVAKCDVRCANCHAKRTRRQMGHWTIDKIGGPFIIGRSLIMSKEYWDRYDEWYGLH